jgi:predicted dehydrogenase
MNVELLDRIVATAACTGRICHEMAGTALDEPYATVREVVASGELGEVIQVLAQKSYPWADWRPGDERVDGGLALQVGVYPLRFAEHVAGMRVTDLQLRETTLGNDVPGSECRRAVSYIMTFANGGLGSAVANYCCPASPSWQNWGYEMVRIFGTNGFVECVDGGRIAQVVVNGKPPRPLTFRSDRPGFFELLLQEIRTGERVIPFTLEDELRPTRWVIRAKYGC